MGIYARRISILLAFAVACSGPVKEPKRAWRVHPLSRGDSQTLLKGALSHLGEPYRFGGASSAGWDCSGYVSAMYNRYLMIKLPRNTRGLYSASVKVKKPDSRPGDLAFFKIESNTLSHVGIYIGDGRFIHASTSRGVIISRLDEEYYRRSFIGFKRPAIRTYARSR